MDLPSAWKATSILFTGAFGIPGLLKEYRDKAAGKIARWGKLSSGGIVVYWLAEMNSD